MKRFYFLFLISFTTTIEVSAQIEPALPSVCLNNGPNNKNNMTVTGNTTFTFANLAEFDASQSSNTITITVASSQKYKLYIAGVMTAVTASATNTAIPINTFTIASTNRGTSPATITLSNSYLEVADFPSSTTGLSHTLTITRNTLNTFSQEPGNHTLTLHIRYCQY
ncbi:MAG: hypothetical protein H7282_09810 [Cytophagaceae bacterium]|nr:hypothetical protein [Cytophagaceae bacterium]